jgi:hypothetical protein
MLDCTNPRCLDALLSYLVWTLLLNLQSNPKKEEFIDAAYMTLIYV